jgi:hypothetical protein
MAEAPAATTAQTAPNPAPATPATAPAQLRPGSIPDAQYDGLTPEQQSNYARVRKGPDGGSEWRDRSTLGDPTDPSKAAAATGDGKASVTADGRLQVGEMLLSEADIRSLITEKAAADLRKTQVPATPESYAAELPKDFKLPEGIEYKFDTSNLAFVDARAWAHREGLTQAQFSQLLSFHANTQIAEQVMIGNAAKVKLPPEARSDIARAAATSRWRRHRAAIKARAVADGEPEDSNVVSFAAARTRRATEQMMRGRVPPERRL